jgi:hypothetical protein
VIHGVVGYGERIEHVRLIVLIDAVQSEVPDLDFDVGEALEKPGVAGDGGDEDLLLGGGGLEAVEEGLFEGGEGGGVFADDGGGLGEDAVFVGVGGDDGFAGGGAGSSGFSCVTTIGFDLFLRSHTEKSVA